MGEAHSAASGDIEDRLSEACSHFYADPLGFVMWAMPWGEKGTPLEDFHGPDDWQREQLIEIGKEVTKRGFDGLKTVDPVMFATASGHGVGKSAQVSFIILWLMSTRPKCKGTVTANTSDQLKNRTWAELAKWHKLCITGHWFEYANTKGNMTLRRWTDPEGWFCQAQTCREENSEAFAGQHAIDSSSFYLFDEAGNVPSMIWQVAEGGLTDGEPFFFAYGNPTRNSGRFFDCFNRFRNRWICRQIDARTCKFPNKDLHKKWIEDWGEDSDFVRVRVRGQFPRAGDLQFIPSDVVFEATRREPRFIDDDPIIMGIDVARGGQDRNVIVYRRGFDARTFKTYIIPGEKTRDSMRLVSLIMDLIDRNKKDAMLIPDAVFVDETGLGGPILDRLNQLGMQAFGVHFGGKALDDSHYVNRAAEMWWKMRDWLIRGGCIKAHPELEMDLTGRCFSHNGKDQLVLESKDSMKERDLASPDWGDALALTFALPVARLERDPRTGDVIQAESGKALTDYNPMERNAMQ